MFWIIFAVVVAALGAAWYFAPKIPAQVEQDAAQIVSQAKADAQAVDKTFENEVKKV